MQSGETEEDMSDDQRFSSEIEINLGNLSEYEKGFSGVIAPNVYLEIDEEKRHKTYAILQETRQDFSENKLKSLLLIYTNSSWDLFILCSLFISYLLDSTIYTFCKPNQRPFCIVVLIICLNFIFMFDVIVKAFLKFFKQWTKTLNIVEPDTIKVILDTVLALPCGFCYFVVDSDFSFYCHSLSPLFAALRVYRIIEYFYNKSSQAGSNQWTTFLFQYLTLFLLSVHTSTCIWYLFANQSFDLHKFYSSWSHSAIYFPIESTLDWYYVCAYWSVTILTTNALGDLYPVTTIERITAIFATLLGFLLTTIVFVGSLTSQFLTISTRRAQYVRQLMKIRRYLETINMDSETTTRILKYYEDLWYQKSGVFKPVLLKMLPSPLQMEICYDLNAVPLYCSLLFRKLPESFLRRLSLAMTHQFYLPGDVIYSHNQNKTFMVCLTKGVIEILSDEDDESPMISFSKGTCLGEIALFHNIPARCTVKAATYVECQVLSKISFIQLMITYPEINEKLRSEIQDRIQKSKRTKRNRENERRLSLNIYASRSRKKSSIKCVKDKLRYIQGKTDLNSITDEDQLEESYLDLYMISDHVKKRISSFTCINPSFPWILEADCYLAKYWEHYMLLLVLYICIFYPYFIGILRKFPDGLTFYIQTIITISLILNVFITSLTAVKTKKKYIRNFKGILSYRMNTLGFYLDIISIIPFEYIVTIHKAVHYSDNYRDHLFYFCKGVKLCLIWRLCDYFEKLENKLLLNTIIIKILKYCVYIILLCYWCGIVLYLESCYVKRCPEISWFNRARTVEDQVKRNVASSKVTYPLLTSMYFSTSIMLSIGYGDFVPVDQYDVAVVAFLSLYGVLLVGYCISEFSAVVTHWSRTKTAFLEIILTVNKFMRENNMHKTIKSRIMAFYELQWQYNSGVELTEENWIKNSVIPSELRKKVLHQARFKVITSIRYFKVKNKAFIQSLTEMAHDVILPPGEILYYSGTITREMYVIESGYCMLTYMTENNKKHERIIGPGNHLCLLVLLYGVPAIYTVITKTHCKLISITYSAYSSALSLFPDMKEHENLLTSNELQYIESLSKLQNVDMYVKHRFCPRSKKVIKITGILQDFFDDSFINVITYYNQNKMNYMNSYNQFTALSNIARYVLLPVVIKPDGIFLSIWCIIRVFSAFILSLLIPVAVAMAPLYGSFAVTISTFEYIMYLDLYVMMHVAYYGEKNQLIFHPYLTAKRYIKGPFLVDLITCFPWFLLWLLFIPKHDEGHTTQDHLTHNHFSHCIVKMVNVLQIYKLCTAFWADSISGLKRAYLMSVVQFFLLTLFFLNLYASILIMLSCTYVIGTDINDYSVKINRLQSLEKYVKSEYNPDGNMACLRGSWIDMIDEKNDTQYPPSTVFLLAYYWAAASLSGAGFGDITAQDTGHLVLSICANIHGLLFFGYVYARIASLKAIANTVVTKFQENMKHLQMFLNREKVPLNLKKSVIEYWKYQWKRTGGWCHQLILDKLHSNLKEDAVLYMYEKTLREIPLFENLEYAFFRAVAKKLQEKYFQKGFMILKSHEVMSDMHIIYRGKVDIVSDINEVEACMGPGGIFGNIRGASRYLTKSNVIASRNTDLLSIDGREFYNLLKSYPSVLKKVKESVDSAAKDYVLPTFSFDKDSDDIETYAMSYEPGDNDDENEIDISQMESPEKSNAESHGSRSLTSTYLYFTSATFLIFKPHRWFRRSIIPDSKFIIFMEYLIIVASYVDFMLLIYQMAFQSITYFFYECVVVDALFIFKLFLDIHTGYLNRYGDYVLSPRKVREKYFSNIFLRRLDFLANLPISYIAFTLSLKPSTQMIFFCYLRTPQLFRISYMFSYRSQKNTNIGTGNLLFKLTSIAIWATILSHINACIFFKLSCLTPVHCTSTNWMSKKELNLTHKYIQESYFTIYIASLWYVINLLTITGTGDVTAQNNFEVIETIIIIIIIKFCTGLLISEMSALISAHSSSRIAYDYGINELRDGLRDMGLSGHQMEKMWAYVKELWNRQQGKQMPELVLNLPSRLRSQVMLAVYGSHIRDSVIFKRTEEDFRRMLALWMRHCVFFPGNYIVQCGDSDQCIYFIHRGQVEVLTVHPNLTESIYDILGPEDSFGIAQGLYVGVLHHFSFRARTVVDIVYLKLEQWKYLLDFYPKSAKIVQKKVENMFLAI
uniref:Cyclic nucleotide-binding domain-containing protein n=1 Tax=Bombyx mori TaxID=7091 RepID=A0A8R2QS84_BOMMO|nr:uncharacterized protein LOC101747086 isoform X1 [Bombyx mori]